MRADQLTNPDFLRQATFVSVDIETTGLGESDAITEIAAVKFRGGEVLEEFASLVNPQRPIPPFITQLTGIDDELVASAPPLAQVLPRFLDFADFPQTILLAHNARFDTRFLAAGCAQVGVEWPVPASVDTVLFSRAVLPKPLVENHRLATMAKHFGIVNPHAHRALADAYTCFELFQRLVATVQEQHEYPVLPADIFTVLATT